MTRVLGVAAIVGLIGLVEAPSAQAQATRTPAVRRAQFLALLGTPSATVRASQVTLTPAQIRAFDRAVNRQGPRPPAIPAIFLQTPRSPRVERLIARRRAQILEIYRRRSLRRGGFAGGVFFTPPAGTPAFPVRPLNIFTYFPVFRVA